MPIHVVQKTPDLRVAALSITQTSDSALEKIPILIRKNMTLSDHKPMIHSYIQERSGNKRRVSFPFVWRGGEKVVLECHCFM